MADVPSRELTAAAYQHFAPYVRRTLQQLGVRDADVADLSHEVFLIVHAKSDRLDDTTHFEWWLREICRRVAAGHRRLSVNRYELLSPNPASKMLETAPESGAAEHREEAVRRALAALDEESRDLLALHEVGELSISELARMTLNDRKTVRKRLEIARHRLATLMKSSEVFRGQAPVSLAPVSGTVPTRTRPLEATAELQVLGVTPNVALGLCGDVAITVWPAAASSSAFDLLIDWAPRVIEAGGGRFGYFAIVESTVRPPALPARRKIVQMLETFGPHISRYATVLIGRGGRIAQPIMSGLMVLVRPRFPMRFFTGVEPAAEWTAQGRAARAAESPGPAVTPRALQASAEALRRLARIRASHA